MTVTQRLAKLLEERGQLELDYLERPCYTLEVEYGGRLHALGAFHDGIILCSNDVGSYQVEAFDSVFWIRTLEALPVAVQL